MLASNSTFRKLGSWHLVPSNRSGNSGNSERLYLGGSKITATMKLKDAYSLEEKL